MYFLIRAYTLFSDAQLFVKRVVSKVAMAVQIVFLPPKYFLFNQDPTPWPSYLIKDDPTWVYNSDLNTLYDRESLHTPAKSCHLPFLSFETKQGNTVTDLSNFIQEIKIYRKTDRFPTIRQLISLWSVQSGTVIGSATISVITDTGDLVEKVVDQTTMVEEIAAA